MFTRYMHFFLKRYAQSDYLTEAKARLLLLFEIEEATATFEEVSAGIGNVTDEISRASGEQKSAVGELVQGRERCRTNPAV